MKTVIILECGSQTFLKMRINWTHLGNFFLEIHVDTCIHNQTPILYTGLRFCKDWGGICLALSVKIV